MDILKYDGFEVVVDRNRIQLRDSNGRLLAFSPGEFEHLRELVGALRRLDSLPVLPDKVEGTSFTAYLSGDGTVILKRSEEDEGFYFGIKKSDDIITALDAAIAKAKDLIIHKGRVKSTSTGYVTVNDSSDLYEGR